MGRARGVYMAVKRPPKLKKNGPANLRVRFALMQEIEDIIKAEGWTLAEAGLRCGVKQPRLSDMMQRRMGQFSLDALVNIATGLGRRVRVELDGD